jgi:REP element-mobilizing transposase RayT
MKPRFDPVRHHRRSMRLPAYDYRSAGAYFVTICTYERELLFEDPVLRRVAERLWQRIPRHFPHVRLDEWVIMPNHIHGILVIVGDPLPRRASGVEAGSLGAIVGNFKSVAARRINRLRGTPGMPVWQRNYYEHVVRDEGTLKAIRQYIADNPAQWEWDTYNPTAVGPDSRAAELWRVLQEVAR